MVYEDMLLSYRFASLCVVLAAAVAISCHGNGATPPDETDGSDTDTSVAADSELGDSNPGDSEPTDSQISDSDTGESDEPVFTGLWIIDTHAHILPTDADLNDAYIDDLMAAVQDAGVAHIALGLHARHIPDRPPTFSEQHDDWTLAAAEEYPDLILPMLAGFDPEDEASVDYVSTELATGHWRAIGELDLRNTPKQTTTPMNHPVMMEIYALAAVYDVPVMFHFEPCYGTDCVSGAAELDEAVTENPDTKFINAHSCPPNLMGNYPNLYCEFEVSNGNLPQSNIFDFIVLGTDIQNAQLNTPIGNMVDIPYGEVVDLIREKLADLDEADAQKLGTGNAEVLFGL